MMPTTTVPLARPTTSGALKIVRLLFPFFFNSFIFFIYHIHDFNKLVEGGIVSFSDSSEKLDNSDRDDDNDDYDDDFRSSTPPPNHNMDSFLMAEERAEMHGSREPSAQPSNSLPGDKDNINCLIIYNFYFICYFLTSLPPLCRNAISYSRF